MDNLLPIGSVVRLHEGKTSLMIIGIHQATDDGQVFDYISCLYPDGFISEDAFFLFNNDDIEEVRFEGFRSDDDEILENVLNSPEFAEIYKMAEEEGELIQSPEDQIIDENFIKESDLPEELKKILNGDFLDLETDI